MTKTGFILFVFAVSVAMSAHSQNKWTQKADFGGSAREGAVGFSIGTNGYIGTGEDGSGFKKDFWQWNQTTNSWTQKADFGGTARYRAVGFSIGANGYIGTGNDGTYKKDFWEYDTILNTWTQMTAFLGLGRFEAVGFSIGSKGYIGTGRGQNGSFYSDFWEYNPVADTVLGKPWKQKTNFGGNSKSGAVGFSIGTQGFIGTGGSNDFC